MSGQGSREQERLRIPYRRYSFKGKRIIPVFVFALYPGQLKLVRYSVCTMIPPQPNFFDLGELESGAQMCFVPPAVFHLGFEPAAFRWN